MSDAPDETWLTRLSIEEWLDAARGELSRATLALQQKQHRAGVAQARRAAGMAWNAVLLGIGEHEQRARYGRSYMDHLKTLREETSVTADIREAAALLLAAPTEPTLVQLGAGDTRPAQAAELIVNEARRRVAGADRS